MTCLFTLSPFVLCMSVFTRRKLGTYKRCLRLCIFFGFTVFLVLSLIMLEHILRRYLIQLFRNE